MYRLISVSILLLLPAVLFLSSCSTTSVSGSWKSPEFEGKIERVYIVGITDNEIKRRIFEDEFTRQFAELGISGLSSYRDLPNAEQADKDQIADKVRGKGADSVLMARAVGKRTEEVVTPGRVTSYNYSPTYRSYGRGYYPAPHYRHYDSYYHQSREIVYQPATVNQYEVVTIDANLYDTETTELIWSAQLETFVDSGLEKLIKDFVKTVTKDLQKQGLI